MIKILFCIIICLYHVDVGALNFITSAVGNIFGGSSNKLPEPDYELESVTFSTKANSNNRMPTKIHMVVVYDYGTAQDLLKRTSKEYFKMVQDLSNTHSQFLKIMEWTLPAKEWLSPYIVISYKNKRTHPYAIIIFTNVGGKRGGEGRYLVSEKIKHLHINVRTKDLQIKEIPNSVLDEIKKYKKKSS